MKATGTKGTKIEGHATVIYKGTAIRGCMAWESPFIMLKFCNGFQATWWPASEEWLFRLRPGQDVTVSAYAYPVYNLQSEQWTLRKVKIQAG